MHLSMVELGVSDLAASVDWYSRLVNTAPALTDAANGFALFEVSGGRVALKRGGPVGGTVHFEVTDLAAELARLGSDAGVKRSGEGYRRAKLPDPDGNTVVLFEWAEPSPPAAAGGPSVTSSWSSPPRT